MADRSAHVVWSGGLLDGSGSIVSTGSGVLGDLPVTWAARAEDQSGGKTSPEELLAAAHASCFCMAFSKRLADNETPPAELKVSATVTFVPGTGITKSVLDLTGDVPGIDEERFGSLAEDAKANCPVSQALADSVDIQLNARLG